MVVDAGETSVTQAGMLLFFPALMAFAAASDLLTMTIPNRVSLLLVAGFFLFAILVGLPLAAVGLHVAAALLVLAVTFGMFAAGWMGGGDAKLAAATALWCGFGQLPEYLALTGMLGGALTLAILAIRAQPLPFFVLAWPWAFNLHHPKTGIPYGIALSAAGLLVYPASPLWRLAAGA